MQRCLFALLLVAQASPAVADDLPKRVALLIGVDRYDHAGLDNLRYAGRDAVELGKVLVANGFTTRVLAVAGKDRPTKQEVEAAVREACKDLTKRDTLLFAFAGQGVELATDRGSDVYLCPSDANPSKPDTLLSVSALLKTLGDGGAGTCLVLLDACRDEPDPTRGPTATDLNRVGVRPNTGVLLGCSAGQRAHESDKLKHGVFAAAVLDGLTGKAKDAAGAVTWDSLAAYVRKAVPRSATEVLGERRTQHPHAIANLAGPPVVLVPVK